MHALNFLFDRIGAAALIVIVAAIGASFFTKKPLWRGVFAALVLLASICFSLSSRSAFDWAVSTLDRTTAPGLVLLWMFLVHSVTGRDFRTSPEFQFGVTALVGGGLVLYPGIVGMFNYDAYSLGYRGILLPAAFGVVLIFAILQRYWVTAAAMAFGIIAFILELGRSRNLWDYLLDPLAVILSLIAIISILALPLSKAPAAGSEPASPTP